MARKLNLSLPLADELFSTQAERDDAKLERVMLLPIAALDPFPDHPYPVEMDEDMQDTVASVKAHGVHTPAIVRLKEDGRYELVSGHRRKLACELTGCETMPCIVREMSRDDAVIMMVDCNLQREKVPPSVKAKAYKMKYDAIKRKAGRPGKENSCPVGANLIGARSDKLVAENSPDSARQIQRYMRLTELIDPIQKLVDAGKIAMRPAVELSYLPPEQQKTLVEEMELEERTPSHVQALKMRKFACEGRLDENVIHSIMQEEKPNQVELFKIPKERINKYFPPGTPAQKIEDTIVNALELWRQRERSREAR